MNDLLADVKAGTTSGLSHQQDVGGAAPPAGYLASSGPGALPPQQRRTNGSSAGGTKNPAYKGKPVEVDIEMGDLAASDQAQAMKSFFAQVELIKADIAEIRRFQDDLSNEHERSKALVRSKDVHQSRQNMQDMITRVSSLASKVKGQLQALERDNEAARRVQGQGQNSANERMRTTMTSGLLHKLKEEMDGFTSLRTRIQDEYRDVVTKRFYTVTGHMVSEDDVDRLIETGEAENIFQKAVVADQQGRARVLDTLAEVRERHDAVKALEHSLLELHQIFLDMAVLIESQGETLNSIEKQVMRGTDAVSKGTGALVEAKRLNDKTRKLWCWGSIIVAIIIIIIVVMSVRPWQYVN